MNKNNVASIRARLKNIADKERKPFDFILMLYFVERLLFRLSISRYSEQFVLKGGLLLYLIMNEKARVTKDIDLLAKETTGDLDMLRDIFVDVSAISFDDAVAYDPDSITTERIKEDADYEGARVKIIGHLGNIRKPLQFDIGFGDVVIPKPETLEYPTLLDMDKPMIKAYSKESVIAEKFEAMLYLAELNSRMKDFYDIYSLCISFDFDGRVLYEAILQTISRRGTHTPQKPIVFDKDFANSKDKATQWAAFKRRTSVGDGLEFPKVVGTIGMFLKPVYEGIVNEKEFFGHWENDVLRWSVPAFHNNPALC
ncbi:MAG: nucleotidyl transferase AbiEii/AbiGii toxin family protein [Defluviitaleaceae bacterium]|nr:nucleotidyl transferase AbiEii/AbiGii toxin family protein [Defluviitaleaceae bacterium]